VKRIRVALLGGRGYEATVGASLADLGPRLARDVAGRRALVVSAPPVARRYAAPLVKGLENAGFAVATVLIPDGESAKNLTTVRGLYTRALRAGLDRRGVVVALGGGVVGDTAGFLAATYMRGVALAQVPTTLLAMVDSAIGGKTGVDLPEGKNLVGAFWQPRRVWMDVTTLGTLPDRQWRSGMGEVIKYGLMADASFWRRLENLDPAVLRRDPAALEAVVARSVRIKADVVAADERETAGLREKLNLGHTFAHAIETVTNYRRYTHGEAVAVGLCAAARLGAALGRFPAGGVARVEALVSRWGLPARVQPALPRPKILAAMARDKKNRAGRFRFILPTGWGRVQAVEGIPAATLSRVLDHVGM
jgi:3-dehydroquinate synthase